MPKGKRYDRDFQLNAARLGVEQRYAIAGDLARITPENLNLEEEPEAVGQLEMIHNEGLAHPSTP